MEGRSAAFGISCEKNIEIGVVGKYIELQDAYKSVYESITHGGIANDCGVKIVRIDAEDIEKEGAEKILGHLAGVVVPGGFGDRGTRRQNLGGAVCA